VLLQCNDGVKSTAAYRGVIVERSRRLQHGWLDWLSIVQEKAVAALIDKCSKVLPFPLRGKRHKVNERVSGTSATAMF
jgi:hypothetical protein